MGFIIVLGTLFCIYGFLFFIVTLAILFAHCIEGKYIKSTLLSSICMDIIMALVISFLIICFVIFLVTKK